MKCNVCKNEITRANEFMVRDDIWTEACLINGWKIKDCICRTCFENKYRSIKFEDLKINRKCRGELPINFGIVNYLAIKNPAEGFKRKEMVENTRRYLVDVYENTAEYDKLEKIKFICDHEIKFLDDLL